jgi:enoyl-CoA hydratase/carnithine racemase
MDGFNYKYLLAEKDGAVLNVWLNRPEARNALSFPLEEEWNDILEVAETDPEVRGVTLRGKGPVFSAGHDLKEVAEGYVTKNREEGKLPAWERRRIPHLPRSWYFRKTLIAGVHGYVGPAAQRMLSPFDFIIAAENTRFSFEQARMGSGDPGGNIMTFLLPMRVIKQMWLLGGWFDAEKAKQLDYVQRVVPIEKLDNELARWADSAAGLNTEQIAVYKEGIHRMYEIAGLLGVIGIGNKVSGHVSNTDKEFFKTIQEKGMKEALRFRQAEVDVDITQIR